MNLHLPRLPFTAGYPALPPLKPEARAIAERLARLLDDEITARRDQIDMAARLATGDDRLSTRFAPDSGSAIRDITAASYEAMTALDRAMLEALDPNETLDLVRTCDEMSQDGMTDAALARLDEIQAPTIGDEHAEHRLTAFDAGVGRYAR